MSIFEKIELLWYKFKYRKFFKSAFCDYDDYYKRLSKRPPKCPKCKRRMSIGTSVKKGWFYKCLKCNYEKPLDK